jgi:hypothetical protein
MMIISMTAPGDCKLEEEEYDFDEEEVYDFDG